MNGKNFLEYFKGFLISIGLILLLTFGLNTAGLSFGLDFPFLVESLVFISIILVVLSIKDLKKLLTKPKKPKVKLPPAAPYSKIFILVQNITFTAIILSTAVFALEKSGIPLFININFFLKISFGLLIPLFILWLKEIHDDPIKTKHLNNFLNQPAVKWVGIPIFLIITGIGLSVLGLVTSDDIYSGLTKKYSKTNLNLALDNHLAPEEEYQGEFTAVADNLNKIGLNVKASEEDQQGTIIYRLKQKGAEEWYFSGQLEIKDIKDSDLTYFNFSPIKKSKENNFIFEIIVSDQAEQPIEITKAGRFLETGYTVDKEKISKNALTTTGFIKQKLSLSIQNNPVLYTFIILLLPVFYLFIHFFPPQHCEKVVFFLICLTSVLELDALSYLDILGEIRVWVTLLCLVAAGLYVWNKKESVADIDFEASKSFKKKRVFIGKACMVIFLSSLIFINLGYLGFWIPPIKFLQNYGIYFFLSGLSTSFIVFSKLKISEKEQKTDGKIYDILMIAVIIVSLFFSLKKIDAFNESPDTVQFMRRGVKYLVSDLRFGSLQPVFENRYNLKPLILTGTPGVTSGLICAVSTLILGGSFEPIIASRIGHVLVNTLFLVGFYFMVKDVYGKRVGFLSTFILAFNPFRIALSRIPNPDSILLVFTFSYLYFLYKVRQKQNLIFYLGIILMLVFSLLTKVTAVILIPVTFFWLLVNSFNIKSLRKFEIKSFFKNRYNFKIIICLVFGIMITSLLWPSLNGSSSTVSFLQSFSNTNVFINKKSNVYPLIGFNFQNWPSFFYLMTFLVRSPLVLVLLFARGAYYFFKSKECNELYLLLAFFIFASFIFLSFSTKKGDKYSLFLYPAIAVFAGYGLSIIGQRLNTVTRILLFTSVLVSGFVFSPYYFESYNALSNYGQNINKFYPAGWGDGHREAMAYISKNYGDNYKIFVLGYASTARKNYEGIVEKSSSFSKEEYDFLVIYNIHKYVVKEHPVLKYVENKKPEEVVKINNVPLAYIYRVN
jgi:hypothetical protein